MATSHFLKKRGNSSAPVETCTCAARAPMGSLCLSQTGRLSRYWVNGLYSSTNSDSSMARRSCMRMGRTSLHMRLHNVLTMRSVRSLYVSLPVSAISHLPVTVFLRKRPCVLRNVSMSVMTLSSAWEGERIGGQTLGSKFGYLPVARVEDARHIAIVIRELPERPFNGNLLIYPVGI